jgi:hypothetical protein
MTTKKKATRRVKEVTDWVTQKEAADERGVELNVVGNWVARGRVSHKDAYGKRLVSRSEVLNYQPSKGGRPSKKR